MEHERDLQEPEQTFKTAVESSVISEIQTQFDPQTVDALNADIESTNLFLLGEMHGVQENPAIIYTLFKKFGFRNLALEWGTWSETTIKNYLSSGILNFEEIKESPDGRITAGHFALFKKMRDEGLVDAITCFDTSGSTSWNQRDQRMADNILKNLTDTPTLVIAGNLHTRTKGVPDFENAKDVNHPMGEHIKNNVPGVPSGNIKLLSGEFYNYGVRQVIQQATPPEHARFYKSADGLYIFELPEAHAATVPNTEETL